VKKPMPLAFSKHRPKPKIRGHPDAMRVLQAIGSVSARDARTVDAWLVNPSWIHSDRRIRDAVVDVLNGGLGPPR